ncbi:MAG TPA: endonuclease V [Desulfurobacteriaceae bacterium]|nr:endonuclease V [Desulfurobacteriaceae bacterium]
MSKEKYLKSFLKIQNELRKNLVLEDKISLEKIRYIAGTDLTFLNPFNHPCRGIGVILVFDFKTWKIVDKVYSIDIVNVPYIPGFLAFREAPLILSAYKKLKIKPDVLIVDGHGIAHPRKMGIAAHIGAILNIPTIGCAKKLLYGKYDDLKVDAGEYVPLYDPKTNEILGYVLRSRKKVSPIFVSPGNYLTSETALEIVKNCLKGYRLPEPTRLAHLYCNSIRKELLNKN